MKNDRAPILDFWGTARLPMLLQTEAAECGLACIAMVAGYWGHEVDLAGMRRRFSISLKGVTLKSLTDIAKAMLLQPRALRLELERLGDLKLPCIVHWDFNHFVVLKRVRRSAVDIHDPAIGVRSLPIQEFSKHFTGVAMELAPAPDFRPARETRRFTLWSLMGTVVGLKRGLLQLLLLGISLEVCSLVSPFYLQWIVDEAVVADDRDLVSVLGIGFLLLVVMRTAIAGFRGWVTTVLATSLNFQWFGNAFSHLLSLPLSFFEKRHLGDIVSRFGSIQTIQKSLTTQFVESVMDGILVIGTFIVMLLYSVRLTLVACASVLLYAALRWVLFRSLRGATSEQIIHSAKQQTQFLESARGIQSIRLFDRADERRSTWMNTLAAQFNADVRIAKLSITYQAANSLLFGAERVIILWLAALAVLDARFSVGMLFAFISYKDQFSQRIGSLVDKVFEFRMLRLHGERLADILLCEPEQGLQAVGLDVQPANLSIEFRSVSFRYAEAEPYVLRDLNLSIPSGQCVAITGPSGCGKTTLVKLLLGLLEPSEGEILVGGVSLHKLGLGNFRRMVGAVMQEDILFAGSIADNICFFDPAPDQNRIVQSAMLSAVHEEIVKMPMGYNTLIGDIGSGLSGGQKQRLLMARALYKNPKLLILDEATSHLDVASEHAVNAAIKQIALTRIIVAHRPETIGMAQRVVVLQQGAVLRDMQQHESAHQLPAGVAEHS